MSFSVCIFFAIHDKNFQSNFVFLVVLVLENFFKKFLRLLQSWPEQRVLFFNMKKAAQPKKQYKFFWSALQKSLDFFNILNILADRSLF